MPAEVQYLLRVDDLLSQEGVLSSVAVKQAPVHLQVPDQCVAGTDHGAADVQVEEDLGVGVMLHWWRQKT